MLKKISHSDLIALLSLLAAWLIFFSRTLFAQLVYFLDDLKIIYYPLESVYAYFQHANQLPLWSRYFGFGQPLLAWGQLGFFNPLHLLLRAFYLPPITLLQVSILAYFALGCIGMYVFLRQQKITAASASLGAFIFTYAGFHVGHLNHVNFYTATMLLPWLLLFLHHHVTRPGIRHTLFAALLAAAIAQSGQPQVVLYTFLLAALWFVPVIIKSKQPIRAFLFTLLLAMLSLSLAAPAILPLAEFLPITERAYGISRAEILEFSYPPTHAITLLFPYFYGDHNYYWGAKNFQELAAYTGIIPLLLIGSAFFSRHRRLQIFGFSALLVGILFALGQYSPLYLWLVDSGVIKSLSIPGRFTLFFVVGVAILAPLGLDALRHLIGWKKIIALLLSLTIISLLFTPFVALLYSNQNIYQYFLSLWNFSQPEPFLILLGLFLFLLIFLLPMRRHKLLFLPWTLSFVAVLTLIIYGWAYNPLTSVAVAYQPSPFTDELQSFYREHQSPPRIYRVDHPSISDRRRTEPISPLFTVIQPIIAPSLTLSCFTIPYQVSDDFIAGSIVEASLSRELGSAPLASADIDPGTLHGTQFTLCFKPVDTQPGEKILLRFSSKQDTGFHLIYQPSNFADQQAFIVRVANPTAVQLARSQKPIAILASPSTDQSADLSSLRLDRHINAAASASSANWIGALSIKTYRTFVASLLDDDIDPVHYDSQSIITDRRHFINLAGITHIVEQAITDTKYDYLSSAAFHLVSSVTYDNSALRLHANSAVLPKAWLVKQAIFSPVDDETISAMRQPNFSPLELVYVNGPTPPQIMSAADAIPLDSQVSITRYEDTIVDLAVTTNQLSWLVFNDSTTPAWHTYIDNQPAPYYTAFSLFKAAQVPAGQHTVSFRYESSATNLAIDLAAAALLIIIVLFALSGTGTFGKNN